ncbi:MAG: UDP-glucose/GDP-mannose dehydrogenase family protein [Pseudomonadota bacterium]
MKISVIGAGYVGLVSGVCFSDFGHTVTCVETVVEKVEMLRAGISPIYEPGLDVLMARNIAAGRLSFSTDLPEALLDADAVFIAVGTPTRRGDGHADLSYVLSAAKDIARLAKPGLVLVTKSTVPVGTNRKIKELVQETNPDLDFDVVSNPEFLREGAAIDDFMRPDRVIIGVETERGAQVLRDIYRPLYLRDFPIVTTDLESAEMIKYASNAFLATKISYINEIATLCEAVGADVKQVAKGMGLDQRIGNKFLHAGPGYGGSCFPKDTLALVHTAADVGVDLRITQAAIDANVATKQRMVDKIRAMCDGDVAGKTILILGATFKPNTDDMRDAPSLTIVPALIDEGAIVRITDSQGRVEGVERLPASVVWEDDPYAGAKGAHLLVILTEWNEFRALDLSRLAQAMATPRMADLRNIYALDSVRESGFDSYQPIGRPGFSTIG